VLGEAWFAGMKFHVDERVLIPRPETEELVEFIVASRQSPAARQQPGESRESGVGSQEQAQRNPDINSGERERTRILDIGTGSGCIPISIKKKQPDWDVWAVDLSADALRVAEVNAINLGAEIHLLQIDILDEKSRRVLPLFDIIVSNPPYIPVKDKNEMRENVLQYEPHLALFADDDDPLIFYREIIQFSRDHLRPGGLLFFEIHEQLAKDVMSLLSSGNYQQIVLKKDMQGKDRMIRALKS
jgi:release factor glutamine methyltransferase